MFTLIYSHLSEAAAAESMGFSWSSLHPPQPFLVCFARIQAGWLCQPFAYDHPLARSDRCLAPSSVEHEFPPGEQNKPTYASHTGVALERSTLDADVLTISPAKDRQTTT